MHPIVCCLPSGRQTTSSSMGIVDAAVPCWAHGAQEPSLLTPTFLETITCRTWVRPFACAFWEEESWSTMVVLGTSMQLPSLARMLKKVHCSSQLQQSSIPSTLWKLIGEDGCTGSVPVPGKSTHHWKQLLKEKL
jgi:hypothetical protein